MEAAGYDRHQVAVNAARMVVKEVLEDGFFHADVHPGNFVVMPGGVIGVMDFGKMGYLRDEDRSDAIVLYAAVVSRDPDGIVDLLVRMGAAGGEVDRKALARDIERVLHKYYNVAMGDIRIQGLAEVAMPHDPPLSLAPAVQFRAAVADVGHDAGHCAHPGPRF